MRVSVCDPVPTDFAMPCPRMTSGEWMGAFCETKGFGDSKPICGKCSHLHELERFYETNRRRWVRFFKMAVGGHYVTRMRVRSQFSGFPSEALQFFRGLARNNNRDWFLPRKPVFEEKVKQPMIELVEAVNAALREFAPEYVTPPEKAVFRIYRDVRFSQDKKPYKEHIAATFHLRGACGHGQAGYYFSISHKEIGIGGGVYMPEPQELVAIRQRIAERHEEFRRILAARPVRKLLGDLQGEQLSRVPKGFPADHPAADLLRFKNYTLYVELAPEVATSPALYKGIVDRFRVMIPFLQFLTVPKPSSLFQPQEIDSARSRLSNVRTPARPSRQSASRPSPL